MNAVDVQYARAVDAISLQGDLGFTVSDAAGVSAELLRYPDFLIIGAQKAGTTWLYKNLDYHPGIWLSPAKELNYFNEVYGASSTGWEAEGRRTQAENVRSYFDSGVALTFAQKQRKKALEVIAAPSISDDWYGRIFAFAPDNALCGEASPDYCSLPRAGISHIGRLMPNLRVFLVIRDPIERCWSHVRMAAQHNYGKTDEDYLRDERVWRVYQGRSNYPEMVRRWSAVLGADRIVILNYEDIARDPFGLLEKACLSLGLGFERGLFPLAESRAGKGIELDAPSAVLELMKTRMEFIYRELDSMRVGFTDEWVKRYY